MILRRIFFVQQQQEQHQRRFVHCLSRWCPLGLKNCATSGAANPAVVAKLQHGQSWCGNGNSSSRFRSTTTHLTTLKTDLWNADLVDRLLSTPVGCISTALWHETAKTLHQLAEPSRLFVILDRLAEEVIRTRATTALSPHSKHAAVFSPLEAKVFNPALHNWKVSFVTNPPPANSACQFLEQIWNKLKRYATDQVVCFDGITYSIVIDAIGRSGDTTGRAPLLAEVILRDAIDLARDYPMTCRHPNTDSLNSLLHVWSKSGRSEAPYVAEAHWATLLTWSQTWDDCCPTPYTYSSMIHVWANSGRPEAIDRAEALLVDMERRLGSEPRVIAYNTALKALAKSPAQQGGKRAHQLLHHMIQRNQQDASFARDDKTGFGFAVATVLDAYRQSGDIQSMHAVVEQMESLAEATGNRDYLPNEVSYATLIDVYASRGQPKQAEAVLQHMIHMARTSNDDRAKPNLITWNTILKAWAKSSESSAVERMNAILASMEQHFGRVPVDSHNVLLSYYMNQGDRESAVLADELLREMKANGTVDTVSYNTVLRALGKAGYLDRAEALLEELCSPHTHKQSAEAAVVMVPPETSHFNTVIDAWRMSPGDVGLVRIQHLLKRMEDLQSMGLPAAPNAASYSIYLDCLSRSKDNGPEQAEQALRRLLASLTRHHHSSATTPSTDKSVVVLDGVTFSTVLAAWARSSSPDSADRMLALIGLMESYSIPLTERMYNMVISSLSNKDRPKEAYRLLVAMSDGKDGGGRLTLQPNLIAYRALLDAWARLGHPDMAAHVLEWMVRDMDAGRLVRSEQQKQQQPFTITTRDFNLVLRAWRNSSHPDAPNKVDRGLVTMKALTASGRLRVPPDLSTYGIAVSTLLQVCANHDRRLGGGERINNEQDHEAMTVSARITHILDEMDTVREALWKEQGPGVCRRMKGELSRSSLSQREIHLRHLTGLMHRHGIVF